MGKVFGREPALFIALAAAGLNAATAFGLDLTDVQRVAVDAFILAATGFAIRSQVTPA